MGAIDKHFENLGSLFVLGSFTVPDYMGFGVGSSTFNGSTNYLTDERLRKQVTWRFIGTEPVANVTITPTQLNGSDVAEVGLGEGASLGSDLHTRDLSAIGVKNSNFSVTINQKMRYRRLI